MQLVPYTCILILLHAQCVLCMQRQDLITCHLHLHKEYAFTRSGKRPGPIDYSYKHPNLEVKCLNSGLSIKSSLRWQQLTMAAPDCI